MGLAVLALLGGPAIASDWARFHGPNGSGISADKQPIPSKWSDEENLKWKQALPGPGSSSPIVVGDKVFVTCWSGYGANRDTGDEKDLVRHLICLDRTGGKVLWDKTVKPVLPEDPYNGMFTQHGYASHTPVSDGKRIYVFFGKTGALAFDLEGNQLWQTSVGTGSGKNGWGTASSPILYKDLVVITASAESQAIVALNKKTGKEVWRTSDAGFGSTWGTPILVDCGKGRTDLVLAVPFKIVGLNPNDGKERWHCEGLKTDSICASAIAKDGIVYMMETGPRGGGTMAVRAGGEGDVSATHVVWRGSDRARIATPVLEGGRIYWVSARSANAIDIKTGKPVYQNKLTGATAGGPGGPGGPGPRGPGAGPGGPGPGPGGPGGPAGSRRGGGRGGMGGGMGGQDYASPVLADGKIIYVGRNGLTFVYAVGPEFKLLGENKFASDNGDFSSTPAVSDGQLFIRSSKYLYCVSAAK